MTEQQFDKNTWQTPKYLFDWLKQRFFWFDLDGCATAKNALTSRYIGEPGSVADDNVSIAPDFLADDIFDVLLDEIVGSYPL